MSDAYLELVSDWDAALIEGSDAMSYDLLFDFCEFYDEGGSDGLKCDKEFQEVQDNLYRKICGFLPIPPEIRFLHNPTTVGEFLEYIDSGRYYSIFSSTSRLQYSSSFQHVMDLFEIPNVMTNPDKTRGKLLFLLKSTRHTPTKFGLIMILLRLLVSTYFLDTYAFGAVSRVLDQKTVYKMINDYNISQTSEKKSSFNRFMDIGKLFEYMKVLKDIYKLKGQLPPPPPEGSESNVEHKKNDDDGRLMISNLSMNAF